MNRSTLRNLTRTATIAALAGAALPAAASNFTWTGGDSIWSNHLNWAGPGGQVPNSILDIAIIAGDTNQARTDMDVSLGGLSVQNQAFASNWNGGAQHGMRMFVDGTTALNDGAEMFVHPGPALTELDTDTLIVNDSSFFFMSGGKVQVDEAASVTNSSVIWGVGEFEMNSTSGDITFNGGGVYAEHSPSWPTNTMTFTRTANSTSEFDWTHHTTFLLAWFDGNLDIQMPVAGSFGGEMSAYGPSFINVADAWVGGNGSQINLSGSIAEPAQLTGGAVDHYGTLSTSGIAIIDVPILGLRDQVNVHKGAEPQGQLRLNNNVIITGGDFTATSTDTAVRFMTPGTTTINGGFSNISLDGGYFDLDGVSGDRTVNIADGSTLNLFNTRIDNVDERFDGTMNVEGELIVGAYNGESFANSGDINVGPNGHINGRRLVNGAPGELVYNGGSSLTAGFANIGHLTVNNPAQIGVSTNNIVFNGISTTTLNADLVLDGPVEVFTDAQFSGTGTLTVVANEHLDLYPDADVDVDVDSEGLLTIAGSIVSINPLVANAGMKSLALSDSSSTLVEFAANDADRYDVATTAKIDGELIVYSADADWYPDFNTSRPVLYADSVNGEFDSVDDSSLGECRRAVVTYANDRVDVTIYHAADVNRDGIVNPADFTAWLAAFNADDEAADVNKNGTVEPADYTKWLDLFNGGC